MRSGIIAIGDEVLQGRIRNTNGEFLTRRLSSLGFKTTIMSVVSDNVNDIVAELKRFEDICEVILITGGLGTTIDDKTREAFCKFAKKKLIEDRATVLKIKEYYKGRNVEVPEDALKQAQIPKGAKAIRNLIGHAVGFHYVKSKTHFFVLPGVPEEMASMYDSYVNKVLKKLRRDEFCYTKDLNIFGLPEILIQERLGKIYTMWENPKISFIPKEGAVTLRITAIAKSQKTAMQMIARLESKIRPLFSQELYSEGDVELEEVVAKLLEKKNLKIAVAESCTGGLLASRLANVPGISKNFVEGLVCYTVKSKEMLLGSDWKSLKLKSQVSAEVATLLAEAIVKKTGADIGVGVTGIAGPTSPEKEKPVGLVYIAVHFKGETEVKEFRFIGNRNLIREKAARTALNMVRVKILFHKPEKVEEATMI